MMMILITTWFGSSTPSVICHLQLFLTSMVHFSMPNSIPISWLYIFTVCIRVSNPFSFLAKSLMSIDIKLLIFSCNLLSLYTSMHFLKMWLSAIMAITNSNGDSASPWNMPLWIFASANLFPPAVNSPLLVYMVFSINYTTWSGILYILRQCSIQLWGTILYIIIIITTADILLLLLIFHWSCIPVWSWGHYLCSVGFIQTPARLDLMQGHFNGGGGSMHKSRLMRGSHKKSLIPSAFLFHDASGAKW